MPSSGNAGPCKAKLHKEGAGLLSCCTANNPHSGPHLPSSSFSTCGLFKWERDGMLKVRVSQPFLSSVLVFLSHTLLLVPFELPAKPAALHCTQVPADCVWVEFLPFLSVLEALFYLTMGNLLLANVVTVHNVKVPRVSVKYLIREFSPTTTSYHALTSFLHGFMFLGEKRSEDWWRNAFTKRRGTTQISQ